MTKKELEIGEYVRLRNGEITKVIAVNDNTFRCKFQKINCELFIDYIVKHSNNIIDLIEEGDYVNGYYCRKINNFCGKMCNFDLNIMEWTPLENIDIFENVVTHEQFEERKFYV